MPHATPPPPPPLHPLSSLSAHLWYINECSANIYGRHSVHLQFLISSSLLQYQSRLLGYLLFSVLVWPPPSPLSPPRSLPPLYADISSKSTPTQIHTHNRWTGVYLDLDTSCFYIVSFLYSVISRFHDAFYYCLKLFCYEGLTAVSPPRPSPPHRSTKKHWGRPLSRGSQGEVGDAYRTAT